LNDVLNILNSIDSYEGTLTRAGDRFAERGVVEHCSGEKQ